MLQHDWFFINLCEARHVMISPKIDTLKNLKFYIFRFAEPMVCLSTEAVTTCIYIVISLYFPTVTAIVPFLHQNFVQFAQLEVSVKSKIFVLKYLPNILYLYTYIHITNNNGNNKIQLCCLLAIMRGCTDLKFSISRERLSRFQIQLRQMIKLLILSIYTCTESGRIVGLLFCRKGRARPVLATFLKTVCS